MFSSWSWYSHGFLHQRPGRIGRLLAALLLWCRGDVPEDFLRQALQPEQRHLEKISLGINQERMQGRIGGRLFICSERCRSQAIKQVLIDAYSTRSSYLAYLHTWFVDIYTVIPLYI